jgi:menaquinone-specific isochorismate synthase
MEIPRKVGDKGVVMSMMKQNIHLLTEGREQAVRTGRNVLVSSVQVCGITDVPAFFSYQDARFTGNRFFWSDPGRELTFAGLGSVLTIEADDPERRFQQVEQKWREIAQTCLADGELPEYTGPVLFGGFSFDPVKPQTALWRHFSHARFFVPRVMLTRFRGRTWLTVNKLFTPRGDSADGETDVAVPDALADTDTDNDNVSPGLIYKEEIAPQEWMDAVEQAAASIRDGHLEKVVLAREIRLVAGKPFRAADIIRRLLREQDNTYVFAIEHGPACFLGATPERLVQSSGGRLQTFSLAGSIARGRTETEDRKLGERLFHDGKNLHEHALAVKMIEQAMAQLCVNVQVPPSPRLHKLKDIQHLLTPIAGQARNGVTLLQAVEVLHPTPALGGMPRAAAMEAIRALERLDRGWYAAPIGWIDRKMNGEFAAAIRSGLIRGNEASLFAGCGIVGNSDPVSEYQETALKFRPMLSALGALPAADAKGGP